MSFSLSPPTFPPKPTPVLLHSQRWNYYHPNHSVTRHFDGHAATSLKLRFGIGSGLTLSELPSHKRRRFRCEAQLGDLAPVTSAVYGSLLLGGGLFAFSRSGSKGSLAGGCTGAVLMATAYYLMQAPETKSIGYALGFGAAFLFSSVFGIRLVATQKLTPAGPLLALSVLALAVFISAYLQDTV
ncbi:protein FATTY ACID EXPORT 4, chloroplastic-like [Rhodamnia argentea]|uniref:Protein FATTY ACID EXPORT 4, chloroplastic-like n=1 Tax=Rhodamnia argentea TaxID=178133 RepID=A0ABM3HXR5_9MYRT|nr:protein FATTY ACID EXPORT 4, chloroplastic-like [Rhodamnia argentea]